MTRILITLLCAILVGVNCVDLPRHHAVDGAYLDPPYKKHTEVDGAYLDPPYPKPLFRKFKIQHDSVRSKASPPASQVAALISKQTEVKSQEARGTCSIFSALAMCESMLIITKDASNDIDYSEEYLQYTLSPGKKDSGSSSYLNIPAIARYGLPTQEEYPYIGEEWKTVTFSQLSQERCGKVPTPYTASCLVGHRDTRLLKATDKQLGDPNSGMYDPDLLTARTSALGMKTKFLYNVSTGVSVYDKDEILALLNAGLPVLLDIDFYYGAWNHRLASNHGMSRNMGQWYNGTVTYPEPESKDREAFIEEPAGHSILLVGYDSGIVVTNNEEMADGTTKTFTYTGVYIFKNSWGTGSFGVDFTYGGKNYPGYGMITMKYADEIGSFFRMSL